MLATAKHRNDNSLMWSSRKPILYILSYGHAVPIDGDLCCDGPVQPQKRALPCDDTYAMITGQWIFLSIV